MQDCCFCSIKSTQGDKTVCVHHGKCQLHKDVQESDSFEIVWTSTGWACGRTVATSLMAHTLAHQRLQVWAQTKPHFGTDTAGCAHFQHWQPARNLPQQILKCASLQLKPSLCVQRHWRRDKNNSKQNSKIKFPIYSRTKMVHKLHVYFLHSCTTVVVNDIRHVNHNHIDYWYHMQVSVTGNKNKQAAQSTAVLVKNGRSRTQKSGLCFQGFCEHRNNRKILGNVQTTGMLIAQPRLVTSKRREKVSDIVWPCVHPHINTCKLGNVWLCSLGDEPVVTKMWLSASFANHIVTLEETVFHIIKWEDTNIQINYLSMYRECTDT